MYMVIYKIIKQLLYFYLLGLTFLKTLHSDIKVSILRDEFV